MSLFLALALVGSPVPMAAQSAEKDAGRWDQLVRAAHQMGVSSNRLHDALRRPDSRSRHVEKNMCFDEGRIVAGSNRTICRTRSEWRSYGLEPVLE